VIFGNSFAMAVFPTLAGLSLKVPEEKEKFLAFFYKSFRAILFFIIPATGLVIVLRAQIIRIILGYGFFGWSDTKAAAATLGLFAISIIAQGLIPLLARTFYALHDTKTPMYASLVSIAVSILSGYLLSHSAVEAAAGVSSLAFAFSIGSWINLFILGIALSKKLNYSVESILSFTISVIFLTVVMLVIVQGVKVIVAEAFDIDRVVYLGLQILAAGLIGIVSYLGLAYLFKFEEVRR
jgi:putative peptidoglycan lipid II flippase